MAMEAGFPVVARGSNEECRAIEVPRPPVLRRDLVPAATFVHRDDNPHPLIMAFVQHVADFHRKRLDDSILT